MKARVEELLTVLATSEQRGEPWHVAENFDGTSAQVRKRALEALVALGPAAAPHLLAAIDTPEAARWVIAALDQIGPRCGVEIVPQLDALVDAHPDLLGVLYRLDRTRALAHDACRLRVGRDSLAAHLRDEPVPLASYYSLLLETEPALALAPLRDPDFGTSLGDLAMQRPDLLAFDLVRAHARGDDPEIRKRALWVLATAHQPEDAALVLGSQEVFDVEWLGALPGGEYAVDDLRPRERAELVRRRRCAGLATDVDRNHLAGATSFEAAGAIMLLAAELRDRETAAALLQHDHPFGVPIRDYALALPTFGEWGHEELRKALRRTDGLGAMFQGLWQTIREHGRVKLAMADKLFANGAIDGQPDGLDATSHYARYLLVHPRNVHAAAQLAVIDRAYGTPITAERIAWLRELGTRDDALLDELATPVTPIPGRRGQPFAKLEADDHVRIAELAEAARFPSIAARHWRACGRDEDAGRARAWTEGHLAQIRVVTSL